MRLEKKDSEWPRMSVRDKPHRAGCDSERRKIERVAAILGLEDTEEQAVCPEKDSPPDHHSQLLSLDIFHSGDLHGECNGCKG